MEVPYTEGWVIPYIHQNGKIIKEEFSETFIKVKAVIKNKNSDKLKEFIIAKEDSFKFG